MDVDLNSRPALAAGVRLRIDPVENVPTLLFPEGLLKLNSTAQEVLSRCDGQRTVAELISTLEQEFESEPGALQRDVVACLAEVGRRQLLIFSAP